MQQMLGQGRGVDEAIRANMASELRALEARLHSDLKALAAAAPAGAAAGMGTGGVEGSSSR